MHLGKHVQRNGTEGERGSAILAILALLVILSTLGTTLLVQGLGEERADQANRSETQLLRGAEDGLHFNYLLLEADPTYAVTR